MLRQASTRLNALAAFVDPNFLNNKRPAIPGGAWPLDSLRKKSIGDLQQIWFTLLKERNMLESTRLHYVKHQEELGAMPAPSRIQMVEESLRNIKAVMRERDFEATDKATAIFKERVERGIYRYPPGPQLPPGSHANQSKVRITLRKHVSEERIRALFGRFDSAEEHRGIAKVEYSLPEEVYALKEEAEQNWKEYMRAKKDFDEYHKVEKSIGSAQDSVSVELAPGMFLEETVAAASISVPGRIPKAARPRTALERLKWDDRPEWEKNTNQYEYFPNVPTNRPQDPPPRPKHPDEIEGPWHVMITYDKEDGVEYARGLGVEQFQGSVVLKIDEVTEKEPYASGCPIYQEAVNKERASEQVAIKFPHVPEWKNEYNLWTKKNLADIIQYNYSNVVDYVDREVLLTGKSSWELPIKVDPTCGGAKSVPPHAKPPPRFFTKQSKGYFHGLHHGGKRK